MLDGVLTLVNNVIDTSVAGRPMTLEEAAQLRQQTKLWAEQLQRLKMATASATVNHHGQIQ